MKKGIVASASLALVVTLAACSTTSDSTEGEGATDAVASDEATSGDGSGEVVASGGKWCEDCSFPRWAAGRCLC